MIADYNSALSSDMDKVAVGKFILFSETQQQQQQQQQQQVTNRED
jgi:hypothetical protein